MEPKVVWVTGASEGIGKETAVEFAKAGHTVAISARRKGKLDLLAKRINDGGGSASAYRCDITSEKSIRSTAGKILKKYGHIDVLINNAGVTVFKSILDTTTKNFDDIIATNLRGAFLCIKEVLPGMVKKRSGSIYNILSVAANTTFENSGAYAASKAGLLALSSGLRKEVRKYGIRITNIIPGAVETAMWAPEMRKKHGKNMMTTNDVARVLLDAFNQPQRVMVEDVVVRPIKGDV